MNENENLVVETTENVEQPTEQTPQEKTYTKAEVDAIVGKRLARDRQKAEREYGDLMDVLQAGTGKQTKSVKEMTESLRDFYSKNGVKMPSKADYSARDIEVLARQDAQDIIDLGYEDVVEEVDRLSEKGVANMTAREKALFKTLAEHRQAFERGQELSEIGVTEDVYGSKDFQDFASKFNSSTPIKDIYDIYNRTQPKKEFKTMGSMKQTAQTNSGVKEYYSMEEAKKFSRKDLDENPALYEAIKRSMLKWK